MQNVRERQESEMAPRLLAWVTGRMKLLSNEMRKAVAKANLGRRSGVGLKFGVPANYLCAGVGCMNGV